MIPRVAEKAKGARPLSAVTSWVHGAAADEGPMLALIGPKGVGKSHLLYGAAWALYEVERTTSFATPWYELADQLRYGDGDLDERGEPRVRSWEVRRRLYRARIVLLDELRPTSGTDLDATELAKFACHAYDDLIGALVTTNWSSLEEVMGEPAADRFTKVLIDGESAGHGQLLAALACHGPPGHGFILGRDGEAVRRSPAGRLEPLGVRDHEVACSSVRWPCHCDGILMPPFVCPRMRDRREHRPRRTRHGPRPDARDAIGQREI